MRKKKFNPKPETLEIPERLITPAVAGILFAAAQEPEAPNEYCVQNTDTSTYQLIALDKIAPSPLNPRKRFDEESLAELAESIRLQGLLEPIIVRRPAKSHDLSSLMDTVACYEIICGERRLRAAKLAGLDPIPAIVRTGVDDRQAIELALIENLCRKDIDAIEEANAYKALQDMGWKQIDIAAKIGRAQPTIANAIRLLDLPDEVQAMVSKGEISQTHGRCLLTHKGHPDLILLEAERAKTATVKEMDYVGSETVKALKKKKLAVEFTYNTSFDKEDCADCADKLNDRYGYGCCLNPSCFKKKSKEAADAALAELQDEGGDKIPKESSLKGVPYERLGGGNLKGCSSKCEHRKKVQSQYGSGTVEVCLDPECYKRLCKEREDAENAKCLRAAQELVDRVSPAIEDPANMSKLAAMLAVKSIRDLYKSKMIVAVAAQHSIKLVEKDLDKLHYDDKPSAALRDTLAALPVETIFRFASGCLIQCEVDARANNGSGSRAVLCDWLCAETASGTPSPPAGEGRGEGDSAPTAGQQRACRVCGCTDDNCEQCVEKTGEPCHWVEPDLCSACVEPVLDEPTDISDSAPAAAKSRSRKRKGVKD